MFRYSFIANWMVPLKDNFPRKMLSLILPKQVLQIILSNKRKSSNSSETCADFWQLCLKENGYMK